MTYNGWYAIKPNATKPNQLKAAVIFFFTSLEYQNNNFSNKCFIILPIKRLISFVNVFISHLFIYFIFFYNRSAIFHWWTSWSSTKKITSVWQLEINVSLPKHKSQSVCQYYEKKNE